MPMYLETELSAKQTSGAPNSKRWIRKSGGGFFKRNIPYSRDLLLLIDRRSWTEAMSDYDDDLMEDDDEYDLVSNTE